MITTYLKIPQCEHGTKYKLLGDQLHNQCLTCINNELSALTKQRDALKQQAEIHAQEARTANATIAEIYQCVTGATGEPGNWNGARPVRDAFERITKQRDELLAVVEKLIRWNSDYPSSRVYGYVDIKQIAADMDRINDAAIAAIASVKGEMK